MPLMAKKNLHKCFTRSIGTLEHAAYLVDKMKEPILAGTPPRSRRRPPNSSDDDSEDSDSDGIKHGVDENMAGNRENDEIPKHEDDDIESDDARNSLTDLRYELCSPPTPK
ncbi:hypothetical protein HOY82DRAFT_614188 [Tuber indicum]|nr:hypothetical protein HOY82DRAFT_614188 [Tuber indicum]